MVIQSADIAYFIAEGAEEGKILAEAMKEPGNISEFPVRLASKSIWVLDHKTKEQFQIKNKKINLLHA